MGYRNRNIVDESQKTRTRGAPVDGHQLPKALNRFSKGFVKGNGNIGNGSRQTPFSQVFSKSIGNIANGRREPPFFASLFLKKGFRKGQYHIISEVLLFAIGIVIVGFIVITFQTVQGSLGETASRDQLATVSDIVAAGIMKATESGANFTIRLAIPEKVGIEPYTVELQENGLFVYLVANKNMNATHELFNISKNYKLSGTVSSASGYIEIAFDGNEIEVRRTL